MAKELISFCLLHVDHLSVRQRFCSRRNLGVRCQGKFNALLTRRPGLPTPLQHLLYNEYFFLLLVATNHKTMSQNYGIQHIPGHFWPQPLKLCKRLVIVFSLSLYQLKKQTVDFRVIVKTRSAFSQHLQETIQKKQKHEC